MATKRWIGGAPAIAQLNTYTFTGTWNAADIVTFTYGNVAATAVTGSSVIATLLATIQAVYAALSSTSYPQFSEQTCAATSTTLTLTANTAGKPFTCTISTNSASGLINGGASSTGTATTVSSGPNDWSTAANWDTNAVPVNTNDIFLDEPGAIKYGLAQSGVQLLSMTVNPGFSAAGGSQIGLPQINIDGNAYPEYRATYLNVKITTLTINTDVQLMRIDLAAAVTSCTVFSTGIGSETSLGLEALLIKGTATTNQYSVLGGQVAIGGIGNEASNINTLTVDGGASVRCGPGVVWTNPTAIVVNSGSLLLNSGNATGFTMTINGGSVTVLGTAAYTTLNVWGGSLSYFSTGTITALNIGGSVVLSPTPLNSTPALSLTVTATNCYGSGSLSFNSHNITWTAAIKLNATSLSQFTINGGLNLSVAPLGL